MSRKKLEDAQAAAVDNALVDFPPKDTQPSREPGDDTPAPRKPFRRIGGYGHNDNLAGAEIMEYIDAAKRINEVWVRFRDGKPSPEVISTFKTAIKEAAEKRNIPLDNNTFYFDPKAPKGGGVFDVEGAWVMKFNPFLDRKDKYDIMFKGYHSARNAIRAEKGIELDEFTPDTTKGRTPF